LRIRTLHTDDIEKAIELEAIVYEHVSGESPVTNNRFDHWFKTIDQELTVGIFDGDTLIGMAYAVDLNPGMNDPKYRQDSLVVHPEYSGQKIGGKLFESLLTMIDCSSPNRASFGYVGDDNKPMQALHMKFGSIAGDDRHTYTQDGRTYRPWTRQPFAHITPQETLTL